MKGNVKCKRCGKLKGLGLPQRGSSAEIVTVQCSRETYDKLLNILADDTTPCLFATDGTTINENCTGDVDCAVCLQNSVVFRQTGVNGRKKSR